MMEAGSFYKQNEYVTDILLNLNRSQIF